MRTTRRIRAALGSEHGAAAAEFALVVPFLFLVVWASINFGRAYQRLNVLNGALREAARYASTLTTQPCGVADATIQPVAGNYATAFGFPLDQTQVHISNTGSCATTDSVYVSGYPLFSDLAFLTLSGITVDRAAVFRWERAP